MRTFAAFLLCVLCSIAHAGEPGFDTVRVDLPGTTQFLYGCTTFFDDIANALSANCAGNHAQETTQPPPLGRLIVASMLAPGYTHWSYDGPCVLVQPHTTAPDGHDSWWLNCGDVIFRDGFEG